MSLTLDASVNGATPEMSRPAEQIGCWLISMMEPLSHGLSWQLVHVLQFNQWYNGVGAANATVTAFFRLVSTQNYVWGFWWLKVSGFDEANVL